ncbi:cytochrome P450 [Xylaria venustula]|nr:cytochrome P450 [Xylaria venustula]
MALLDRFTVAAYAVYFIIPFLFLVGAYRVKLHPLRRYPGPLLAKLTDYIYQNPNMTKSHLYVFSRLRGSPSIFSTIEKKRHRQKRQFFSQALSDRLMSMFEPVLLEHITTFLQLILKSTRNSEPLDMSSRCQYLTFDIIGSLAVGQRLNLQLNDTNRILLQILIAAKYRVNILMHFPPLRILNPVLKMIPSRPAREFARAVANMVKIRTAQTVDGQRDLCSFLAQPASEGVFESTWSELIFFITAGGTPPAATICAIIFYLSQDPERYALLTMEIRSTFSSADEITSGARLSSCKYLRACIDESLRMNPPSLATLWREQSEDGGESMIIDGHVVPRGTQVGVNIYSLHHNEEYFPEPFSMYDAFVPFLVGPRSCSGKAMVYQEVSLIIAKTLWYFDFELCSGALGNVGGGEAGNRQGRDRVGEFQMFDVFNSHHQGPNLIFKTRGGFYTDLERGTETVG